MTITRVQGNARGTATSGTSISITMTSAPANGNVLVLTFNGSAGTSMSVSSISQSGVTWNASKTVGETYSSSRDTEIWLASVGASASTSITVNLSVSGVFQSAEANVCEYSGLTTTVDQSTSNSGTSTTINSGTTTTTINASDLIVASLGSIDTNGHTVTQSSAQVNGSSTGVTLLDGADLSHSGFHSANGYVEYIASATGTFYATDTIPQSETWGGAIAAIEGTSTTPNPVAVVTTQFNPIYQFQFLRNRIKVPFTPRLVA